MFHHHHGGKHSEIQMTFNPKSKKTEKDSCEEIFQKPLLNRLSFLFLNGIVSWTISHAVLSVRKTLMAMPLHNLIKKVLTKMSLNIFTLLQSVKMLHQRRNLIFSFLLLFSLASQASTQIEGNVSTINHFN